MDIRPLEEADFGALRKLRVEAFGAAAGDSGVGFQLPGSTRWGAFVDNRLIATANHRCYETWMGGSVVPTCGFGGVMVTAEFRRSRAFTALLHRVLESAVSEGALLSTLFPSIAKPYRRLGFEVVTAYDEIEISTSKLRQFAIDAPLRRAELADVESVWAFYDQWASQHNGPLIRRGPSFGQTPQEYLNELTGVTLVGSTEQLRGFASWKRTEGYTDASSVEVYDLVASDPSALQSLLAMLGTFDSVTGTVRIRTSGGELLQTLTEARVVHSWPYMARVLSAHLLTQLSYPEFIDASLPFTLGGEPMTLQIFGGKADVVGGAIGGRAFTDAGLTLAVMGTATSAQLRRLGLLSGSSGDDAVWDALFRSRQPHIRDYF